MSEKIYWTERERQIVVERGRALLRVHPGTSTHGLLEQGQKQLPENRRKSAKTIKAFGYSSVGVDMRVEMMRIVAPPAPLPEPFASAPKAAKPDALEESIQAIADRLVDVFASRLRERMVERVRTAMSVAVVSADAARMRMRKKRVLVVGALDGQAEMLAGEFRDLLDVRFFEKDRNPGAIAQLAQTVDHVVLWTDFISHAHQESTPKEKSMLVHGGMDAVREKLEEIYCS